MSVVIAHRGDHARHPENTLEAFAGAVALGATMVELDCRLSADGHVVVLHDDNLKRVWGLARPVSALRWADISSLRCHGCRIPHLGEALAGVSVPVMVDVPGPAEAEAALAVAVEAGAVHRCVFSGSTAGLRRLRRLSTEARLALTWDRRPGPGPELVAELQPQWVNPHWSLVSDGLVQRAHASGTAVSVWTVDQGWAMRRVLAAGVDAVVTNHVGRLAAVLARPRRRRPFPRLTPVTPP